ncbi:M28 family peptidase [Dyadobacter sp. BHUBP1]|uniref:M28 family peptidase n=1 Tax=Dyadobacter sp. BHUBP1 TaxID=3424178 RepID=UPI003D3345DD
MKARSIPDTARQGWACLMLLLGLTTTNCLAQQHAEDSLMIRKLFDNALTAGRIGPDLRYLTSRIGPRMSGSDNAQKAVEWGRLKMQEINPDSVYLQEVMVPHWVRGNKEKSFFTRSNRKREVMQVCALGGSVGTNGRLTARVVEVRSWAELAALKDEQVRGKFVFFNRAMDPREIETFNAYLGAVDQRSKGAIEASKRGAVGALVRSLTLPIDTVPHTGAMGYDPKVVKIPAAALSTKSANLLSESLRYDPDLLYSLTMDCRQLPDVKSYNVIGEIKGAVYPGEFITVGGHIDTWDLSEGASDDGTGFVQTLEVLRLIKTSGKRPERSIRAILYMNEEAGADGAIAYARQARLSAETHLAVLESDAGGFTPRGFRIEGSPDIHAIISGWKPLLAPYKIDDIHSGHRGVDLAPMKGLAKALISLDCDDQRLFDIHHSALDTYDRVNIREVELGAASMAVLISLISKYGL